MLSERCSDHNDLNLLNNSKKWNNKRDIDVVFSRNVVDYEVEHIYNVSAPLPQLVITFMMIMMIMMTFRNLLVLADGILKEI